MTWPPGDMVTAGELLLELVERLEDMPERRGTCQAVEITAPDGTALIVTLKSDHLEGFIE